MRYFIPSLLLLLMPVLCLAWNGYQVTQGDLTVLIEEIPEVTQLETPVPVTVTLDNAGEGAVQGVVEIRDLVDETRVVGEARKEFEVQAGANVSVPFEIAFGKGCHSALYPVHAWVEFDRDEVEEEAHAVRIVRTRFRAADVSFDEPGPMEVNRVPTRGAMPLWTLGTQRVAWQYFDKPLRYKPSGWTGSDPESRASMSIANMTRGETKPVIQMHPTWWGGQGTVFCDYLLQLPQTTPIKLTFANAIRDNTETEPVSDGVLFRVWAADGIAATNPALLYEKFTDAKRWLPGQADLSAYAGKTILLRLESHPGPDRDTTCDASYWAEPSVVAGEIAPGAGVSFEDRAAEATSVGRRLLLGTLQPDNRFSFLVGTGLNRVAAVLVPTERGIIDGVFSIVGAAGSVSFDGFNLDILKQHAVRTPTAIDSRGYSTKEQDGRAIHTHHLMREGRALDVTMTVWVDGEGLRIAWDSPVRVTDFSLGRSDAEAAAVYYGHGYRIVDPKPFRAGFGGHNLASSHVGCDFGNGLSLLQAVDVPPNYFEVDPGSKTYSLHTHMNGTLTLVAGAAGALDCAVRYRPLFDKKPSGGVERLAGRMCFDIWGGSYANIAEDMARMVRYGLTDSFLTVHNWQRWGYDYQLPDIWPPNPAMGTLEDMRKIGEVCDPQDIPWGLHDNYIDFYPDAGDYTYDDICFRENGTPIAAWYNTGRDAQSYRWRPDSFMPFLKRNLRLIKQGVAPSHYFIDVFTSIGCIDFYDREGNFHSSIETRQKWGEAFAWIRDYLGNNAPTTSEAGHDQLIGYLDGADCQHLTLSDSRRKHTIYLPCGDWERVPWYDAVNHHRFILHGVGYSGRYQGGRDRRDHGINSDDYISAEVLEGHALMVDAGCWGREAVRKYWLAQPVARNLALRKITSTQFVDGDMHRAIVSWDNGTKVYVNRGEAAWDVEGHVLPQYGYLVLGDDLTSAIETRDDTFSESCITPDYWYCNARTHDADRRWRIRPRVENLKYLGDQKFSYDFVWEADEPAPRDMRVFVHFYGEEAGRPDGIVFQDDHSPETPTNQWDGTIRYTRVKEIPEDAEGEYKIAFGMYDARGRLPMRGAIAGVSGGSAVWVGTLRVARDDNGVTDIAFELPPPAEEPPLPRINLEGKPIDFGFAVTDGAIRIERTQTGWRVTPLPDSPACVVALRLAQLDSPGGAVQRVVAVADDGTQTPVSFDGTEDLVRFRHEGKAFAYDLTL